MVVPIQVMHHKMPVLGFRIADFAYITDAKTISEKELEKVKGTKILIVNALHRSSHISHFNLEEALEFINKVKPQQAYLTHISHLFGLHEEIEHDLPEGVSLAYDGLTIEI
jgi:phosphoribosyl 1,2-cyclic phosphate phosphodiesterase